MIHIWDDYYAGRIQAVLDGTWKPQSVWGGAPEHMVALVDIAQSTPKAVQDDIAATYEKMAKREFHPFTGPVVSNEGKEMLAKGAVATDEQLLTMNYLVKGVAGKLPTAN